MSERDEAIARAIPGRLEELELKVAQLTGDVEGTSDVVGRILRDVAREISATAASQVSPLSTSANVNTLTEDVKLTEDTGVLQFIDPNGGERTVFLPRAGVSNKWYVLINTAS
jgi:hypothetical protein